MYTNSVMLVFIVVGSLCVRYVCARLAQLVRSLTANHEVPGSIPSLVEG